MIDRPTEDVGRFTVNAEEDAFGIAVDQVPARLLSSGCHIELTRRAAHFARWHVLEKVSTATWPGRGLEAGRASAHGGGPGPEPR